MDSSKRADRLRKPGGSRSGEDRAAAEACIKRTNSDIIGSKRARCPEQSRTPAEQKQPATDQAKEDSPPQLEPTYPEPPGERSNRRQDRMNLSKRNDWNPGGSQDRRSHRKRIATRHGSMLPLTTFGPRRTGPRATIFSRRFLLGFPRSRIRLRRKKGQIPKLGPKGAKFLASWVKKAEEIAGEETTTGGAETAGEKLGGAAETAGGIPGCGAESNIPNSN